MASSRLSQSHAQRLAELDRRHDDLLEQIDQLDARVEAALAELGAGAAADGEDSGA
jgi:hypothetical protein